MSEKFVLFLWELSLLSKNHQSHFSSQGPFYLFATATPKSHLLKGCLEAHAFECFSHAEGGTQVHRGDESSDALPSKSGTRRSLC